MNANESPRIDIYLDDHGDTLSVSLRLPELTACESACIGRRLDDLPRVNHCGCDISALSHRLAAAKAIDAAYHIEPPPTAKKLRELSCVTCYITDITTHLTLTSTPELSQFVMELNRTAGQAYQLGRAIIDLIGAPVPGGMAHGLDDAQRQEIGRMGSWLIDFASGGLRRFDEDVLADQDYLDRLLNETFYECVYNLGTVDAKHRVNLYDGAIGVASPNGHHLQDVPPRYLDNLIAEHAEPQIDQHFSYLKTIGWKGLVDGRGSGVFCASPLSRMNVAEGMATPRAQEEYEQFYDVLVCEEGARYLSTGPGRALHHVLGNHWARLIEMLYAAERIVELAADPTLTADDLRTVPTEPPTDGIGIVEAPSGTITHHYWADEQGIVTQARLMSGTRNNLAAIGLTIKKAAQDDIRRGSLTTAGLRKSIELVIQAHDPCLRTIAGAGVDRLSLPIFIRNTRDEVLDQVA